VPFFVKYSLRIAEKVVFAAIAGFEKVDDCHIILTTIFTLDRKILPGTFN